MLKKFYFVGNNDVYVMNEWNMQHGSPEIITISDPAKYLQSQLIKMKIGEIVLVLEQVDMLSN